MTLLLPTSGQVILYMGQVVVVTFLPDTPATGRVDVQIDDGMVIPWTLFAPC